MNEPIAPESLRPVRTVARCAIVAFALAVLAWVVRALWQLRLAAAGVPASGPPDQGGGRHRPLNALENSYHLVSDLGDATTALCAITFLVWLWRVRDNARALSGQPPRYGWPWVYAGWIVPIINLWVPRSIVADAHRASAPDERLPWVVNVWWGLWLVGLASGLGPMYTGSTDTVIARAYDDVNWLLVGDAGLAGAALAGAFVVRALTSAQQRRIDGLARRGEAVGQSVVS
ncbi:DUF4328 domain-containing protein [Streptomyces sp. NPDC002851]